MRHRFLLPLALAALFAVGILVTGCGSSDGESSTSTGREPTATTGTTPEATATVPDAPAGATAQECGNTTVAGTSQLRVTGVGCPVGRGIVASWSKNDACTADSSRPACTVNRGYRCIAARTNAGLAVSCARSGRSLSFIAKPN
ncbi:MAG TPA: hypothetical protein VFL89_03205 [Solirubrobacterales bacterium]|nr:hypothetical protein [Solirubrobacterales bacterium]